MAKYTLEESTLTNIADAIRAKTGKNDKITPSDFAEEISSIEGNNGVVLPTLSNPASASDILMGKDAIDASGEKITGSIETFDGSY
jgi:hypothetical protein